MNGLMMQQPLLISSQLEFAARFHQSVEIVTRTVEGPIVRTTWSGLAKRVRQLANSLSASGIKRGDVVATLAWNMQCHLELYFAVSGIAPTTVRPVSLSTSSGDRTRRSRV